jgi:hypothetical protein
MCSVEITCEPVWPTHQVCQHCDDTRAIEQSDGRFSISIADCAACGTTCCDECYEQFHTGGPCEPDARVKAQE